MREQETLESLEREQTRHSLVIERRRDLLAEIEQRKLDPGFTDINNWTSSLRTLDLQERVETIISIRGSRLAGLERRIEEFSGPLVTRAEEYRVSRAQQGLDLAEFERFYRAGRLGPNAEEIMTRRNTAFAELVAQEEIDLELKRGLEILQRREQPTQEIKPDQRPEVPEGINEEQKKRLELLRALEQDVRDVTFTTGELLLLNLLKSDLLTGQKDTPVGLATRLGRPGDIQTRAKNLAKGDLYTLRRKLKGVEWDINNPFRGNNKKTPEYELVKKGSKADKIITHPEDIDEETITFLEKFQKDIEDIYFTAEEQKIIDYYLDKRAFTEKRLVNSDELMDFVWGEGTDRKRKSERLTTHQARIKNKLRTRQWKITNIHTRSLAGEYYLKLVEVKEEVSPTASSPSEVEPEQSVEPALPKLDLEINLIKREVVLYGSGIDRIVKITDLTEWEIFKFLSEHPNQIFTPYSRELMAIPEKLGITVAHYQSQRVKFALSGLIGIINPEGFEPVIRGGEDNKISTYEFTITSIQKPSVEDEGEVIQLPEEEEEDITLRLGDQLQGPDYQEVRRIPYIPSEDEKRSPEETKVLDVIISAILNNPYHKLNFDELQRQLNNPQRMKRLGGDRLYHLFLASELKLILKQAFDKIREEELAEHLQMDWSEQDHRISMNIQVLKNRLRITEDEDLIRKINSEITRSQNQFYRANPPETGIPVGWIKVAADWRTKDGS